MAKCLKEKTVLPKCHFPRTARGQLWSAWTNISTYVTAAPLKRRSSRVSSHFPACCHMPVLCQAQRLACRFPRWPFAVTSFPALRWQQAPITCMSSFRAAPALSSFVRMKVSSQSCTTWFVNAGLLPRLCSISMQNNEDRYYTSSIN